MAVFEDILNQLILETNDGLSYILEDWEDHILIPNDIDVVVGNKLHFQNPRLSSCSRYSAFRDRSCFTSLELAWTGVKQLNVAFLVTAT